MITSTVNHKLELAVSVPLHDAASQVRQIEFVIDTGFAGELSLPASVVAGFGFPFVSQIANKLSDGTVIIVPEHRAVVLWDGAVRIVQVVASSGSVPLLGMGMLRDFDLRARCQPGGLIEIEKAP
jgi:clan AA aspartic protease